MKKSLKEIRDELFGMDTGEVIKARVDVRKISLESLGRTKFSSRPICRKKLKIYFDDEDGFKISKENKD